MNKEILVQYCEMREEIKDLRQRIMKLDKFLSEPHQVSDTVKGTRPDGTIGNIRITGYPVPEYYQKRNAREVLKAKLEAKEGELLELTNQAEEYIESVDKSELRTMFRLYYLDGLTWVQVAHRMNSIYPKRRVKFSEDNCWRRNKRFFENL